LKILSLILFFSCLICLAPAQTARSVLTVRGFVVDSITRRPLAYVTIVLSDKKSRQNVRSALSQEDGSFEIVAETDKTCRLLFTFTGYNDKTVALINQGTYLNVGIITLAAADTRLKEVTITGQRPVIKRELDRISYDVGADPESISLTTLDIMRKVPLLTVDAADNIKLKGSGNFKILINGKESALIAKSPSDVLRAMPATNVEKIEVITTPPSKYDAEGLAGIVNIITSKNISQGYNIGINARYNTVWGPGMNINGTLKQGKFGVAAFAGQNVHNKQTPGFGNSQIFNPDKSVLSQNGTNTLGGHHNYANLEISYEIDSLNLLTASLGLHNGINNQSSDQFSTTRDNDLALVRKYHLNSTAENNFEGLDVGLNYELGFKKDKNRLLTVSYKYNYAPNKQSTDNSFSDTVNFDQPPYRQYNNAGNREHTIQLDYVRPFKTLTIETGGKVILRNNFSIFQTSNYDKALNDYIINPAQTNDFRFFISLLLSDFENQGSLGRLGRCP